MAASHDECLVDLAKYVISGFPNTKEQLPVHLHVFWNVRHDLSVLNGLVLFGSRIVIPSSLRLEVLEILQSAHQGITGMKARSRMCVYWPGINGDITNRRLQCRDCNDVAPSQPNEPV